MFVEIYWKKIFFKMSDRGHSPLSLGYDNQSGQKPLNKWRVLPDLDHILYYLTIMCSNRVVFV